MNLPPIVRSDHVSVNWLMLMIAICGAVVSGIVGLTVIVLPLSEKLGRGAVWIMGVEAAAIWVLSIVLLYRSLRFFGIA